MKTLFIVIILIIILVGGWFLFANDAAAPANTIESNMPVLDSNTRSDRGQSDEMLVNNMGETMPMGGESDIMDTPMMETREVTYTDNGFFPASIEISSGDSVKFVNKSSRTMWIASAMHPTHSVYPEKSSDNCLGSSFDACKALGQGESWSFTFNSAGSWKYHNHMRAVDGGTVVVK